MGSKWVEPTSILYNPVVVALWEAGRSKEELRMLYRFLVLNQIPQCPLTILLKAFCKADDLTWCLYDPQNDD